MPASPAPTRWSAPPLPALDPVTGASLSPALMKEIEQLKETARQSGFEAGFSEGLSRSDTELEHHKEAIETLLKTLENPYQAHSNALHKSLAALAGRLAELLARRELSLHPQALIEIAESVIGDIAAQCREYTLELNQQDMAQLQIMGIEIPTRMTLESQPELLPGDARIQFSESKIDLRILEQLAAMVDALPITHGNQGHLDTPGAGTQQ